MLLVQKPRNNFFPKKNPQLFKLDGTLTSSKKITKFLWAVPKKNCGQKDK